MKFIQVLQLAALSTAFVLPSQELFSQLAVEDHHGSIEDIQQHVTATSKNVWQKASDKYDSAIDTALDYAHNTLVDWWSAWLDMESIDDADHHGPPHHGKPHHGRPHRGHHDHDKSNLTIFQLIDESKYTTELAKLIGEYDDLVEALNSTAANFTVFAPTNKAFEKIPSHAPKPSKEQLKDILSYHVVPGFYPAGRVLASHTAATLLKSDLFGPKPLPQRIAFKIGLNGLSINFYSRIIALNIFASNGVIHGVDSIILPPPTAIQVLDLFPGEFSTLELGLSKTGLLKRLNATDHHPGGTLFAPSNFAFRKLGPKVNAFLFSEHGLKYLTAILEYHVVPGHKLYSDAYYPADSSAEEPSINGVYNGVFHVDLPTLLDGRHLAIDVARFSRLIEIKINAFARVTVQDAVTKDGVIHVVSDVIIPPKKLGDVVEYWTGGEMEVEDLIERLEPFVARSDL